MLTTGTNFPDGVAAAGAAAHAGGAVLLTEGTNLPPATAAYLASVQPTTRVAVGGPAAAAVPTATAIVGADRYETAGLLASRIFPAPAGVSVASGTTFPMRSAVAP